MLRLLETTLWMGNMGHMTTQVNMLLGNVVLQTDPKDFISRNVWNTEVM